MTESEQQTIRNLTRKKKVSGQLYERPIEIETQIKEINSLEFSEIVRRIKKNGARDMEQVQNETIVYLIRDDSRSSRDREVLLTELLIRCERVILSSVFKWRTQNPEELCNDILQEFAILFANDRNVPKEDELDFFECRFNLALKTFIGLHVNREINRINVEQSYDLSESDETVEVIEATPERGRDFGQLNDAEKKIYIEQMLDILPSDVAHVFALCKIIGYSQKEVSVMLSVTERTIRNKIKRSNEILNEQKSDFSS